MRTQPHTTPSLWWSLLLFGFVPPAHASTVDVLSTPAFLEPTTGQVPNDKDGCPPVSSSADPEEGSLQVRLDVDSALADPNLLVVDTNTVGSGPHRTIDDLTIDDPTTGTPDSAGVVRDLDYLDGILDDSLAAGTYYVYFNLDKTGYSQGVSPTTAANCAGNSFAGDLEMYTATLRQGTVSQAVDTITTKMDGSAGVRQNDLDWLDTEPDAVSPQLGEPLCIRSKYSQSSAQGLYAMVGMAYYNADVLRLDSVDVYYYDTDGVDPGSVEFGVPGVTALGIIPENSFRDQMNFVEADLASLGDTGSDLSSGDHWISEYCFTVMEEGATFFSPYFQTRASSTSNWKVDSGFGQAVIFSPAVIDILKECDGSPDPATYVDGLSVPAVIAGIEAQFTHDLHVCNTGSGDAADVVVVDSLPADPFDGTSDVSFVDATSFDPLVSNGEYDAVSHTITWMIASLPAETCVEIPLTVALLVDGSSPDATTNAGATASAVSAEDPSLETSATTFETCPIAVLVPGLAIEKVASGSAFAPGDTVTYTINVTNTGAADLSEVSILDNPDESAFVSVAAISGGGAYDGNLITWDIGALQVGDSIVVSYDAILADADADVFQTGSTPVSNLASADSRETSPQNDGALIAVVALAELAIEKQAELFIDVDGDGAADPGDTLLYSVTVDNIGDATAHDLLVTDDVDELYFAGVANISHAGTYEAGLISWSSLGDLAPGADPITLSYEATLVEVFPEGTTSVDNTAIASSAETPPVEDSVNVPVDAAAFVSIEKSISDASGIFSPGDTVHYEIAVCNGGNADATDMVVTDDYDESAFALISNVSVGGVDSGGEIEWVIGSLAAETCELLSYEATLFGAGSFAPDTCDALANPNDIVNLAVVVHDSGSDSDDEIICVSAAPALSITKAQESRVRVDAVSVINTASASADAAVGVVSLPVTFSVQTRVQITYDIDVCNIGDAEAAAMVVTDVLDSDVQFASASASGSHAGGVVTWNLGTVEPGECIDLDLVVKTL